MDDHPRPRRARATAGTSAMGAAALLVLSFGPSALAVSPTPTTAAPPRAAVSSPAPLTSTPLASPRPGDEDR